MKKQNLDLFDKLMLFGLTKIGFEKEFYLGRPRLQRFTKFAFSTFLMFWLVKGPLIALFTERLLPSQISLLIFSIPGYVLSSFIVGIILTFAGFVVNEFWTWGREKNGD